MGENGKKRKRSRLVLFIYISYETVIMKSTE